MPFETILLSYDGSPHARRALDAAVELVRATGADLHVVSTPEPAMPAIVVAPYGDIATMPLTEEQIEEAAAAIREDVLAAARAAGIAEPDLHVRRGDPVANAMSVADATGADLIVMGRRGLGALGSLALGSVSQAITHRARCACMTVI
ncbi:universal stress protein [Jannaschia sp. S6380]|uniref:universal stress protein n=1 Tax=Jannaschia sp. S6380 TaxID=2926408 RepID=UPI001FF31F8A|nr:universal stress protein [Jannaschia sp. S6380]MCK0167149.1 universal stress protein [Jannaschia sp. S6380]